MSGTIRQTGKLRHREEEYTLAMGQPLAEKHKDHSLIGNYKGCRECHITPDWLLIYEISDDEIILYLTRTGTHSDLL